MSAVRTAVINTWRGLIQRRLWPVALLLVVALVAVPLLLLVQPEPDQPPTLAQTGAAGDSADLIAQPLVAAASPSDRDRVRRVLGDRKDPFKPSNQPKRKRTNERDTARTSSDSGAQNSPGASGGSGPSIAPVGPGRAPAAGGSPAPAPGPARPGPPPGPARPGPPPAEPRLPAGSLSVRWGSSEGEDLEDIDIERLDPLPSAEEPVLVYLGVTDEGDAAVFLVDAGVTVDGDARCRPTPDDCQTFELRAGETEFVELEHEGGEKVQFQLDLVKIHGRKAERAKAARRSEAGEARATRRALRSLGGDEREHRLDARPYTSELILTGP